MNDLIRTVIVGFASGFVGAMVVLAVAGDGDNPEPASALVEDAPIARTDADTDQPGTASIIVEDPEPAATITPDEQAATVAEAATPVAEVSRERQRADANVRREERMVERLRQAGWSELEIESLDDVRNAAALEMEQLMYERMREDVEQNRNAYRMYMTQNTLREALGDERYEQYLEASGRQTAVTVRNLLRGSAADSAGIREGDLIRRYGDQRIYNDGDLFNALIEGEPGESVTIEVERNGNIFHVTVPRGPLGTSGFPRRWP